MRFALVNGQRQEAQPNLSGECPYCGGPTVSKCGEFRVWHWAHKGHRLCDPWWENETEWHRAWKNHFPANCQEIVHSAGDGERHIADVKTGKGWVIEFQHSYIKPEERRSREAFYQKLIWVVDGTRRKRDAKQFIEAAQNGARPFGDLPIVRVRSDECTLLREWAGSHVPILFDFGSEQALAWLIDGRPDGPAYVGPVARASFIEMHQVGGTGTIRSFDELVKDTSGLVADYESYLQAQALKQGSLQPLLSSQRYAARRHRYRRPL